jgi:hypothetical protein
VTALSSEEGGQKELWLEGEAESREIYFQNRREIFKIFGC